MNFKLKILEAARSHFESELLKAELNLENYLLRSSGIGEHPDIMNEVILLIKKASEAKEALEYTLEKLPNKGK